MVEICFDILDSISSMIDTGRAKAVEDLMSHKRCDQFLSILVKVYGNKIEMLNRIHQNPLTDEQFFNYVALIYEESNKLSHVICTLLHNDGTAYHLTSKGILKVMDTSLRNLLLMPSTAERNDLLHNFIIMMSNLFGDYETSDLICDKMFKETKLADIVFEHFLFKVPDRSLLKTIAKDMSYLINNLSETDDPWCLD